MGEKNRPTAKEMADFCKNFDKTEWRKLCLERAFINALLNDLVLAKNLANKILGKKTVDT